MYEVNLNCNGNADIVIPPNACVNDYLHGASYKLVLASYMYVVNQIYADKNCTYPASPFRTLYPLNLCMGSTIFGTGTILISNGSAIISQTYNSTECNSTIINSGTSETLGCNPGTPNIYYSIYNGITSTTSLPTTQSSLVTGSVSTGAFSADGTNLVCRFEIIFFLVIFILFLKM